MRLIENATGLRRFMVLAGLLAMTWLAVVVVGSLAATALSAAASLQPTSGGTGLSLSEAVHRVPRILVEALASAAVLTVAPFLPSSMNLGDRSLLFGAWLPFMSIIVSGTLISLPLVGLRNRGKLPLRWSIVSGGVLGGMLGIGAVLVVLDGIRLLDLSDPLAQVTATGGRMSAMAVLLLVCWIVAGWMWARALARAGRAGHPDVIAQFVRRLFAGTCVELAIAAPTYALGIRRSDCWCGWGSWFSIVGGVAILTVLCGPMLVLLWTREARLQWMRTCCRGCGYPLRTGSAVCSECGLKAHWEPETATRA